ncbi:succinoglycan biosynthesis protein ExoA [Thioclava sp. ES.031]|uniref:glycosyltransferase family 2 protein n=1 Tax=Thioclava sp. ES.031 TaxID=1798203 RepID=UPI000BF2CFED|nr:glycosyltransferase family 2 protein [Thioclava sp. ES.031]PFG63441.1 succinoglycan biosynthesis protein ExoA [Thioclava sp. ES.031]
MSDPKVLVIVPTLNEAAHIGAVLDQLAPFAKTGEALVVVVDGGSRDGTQDIVTQRMAQTDWLRLIDNPLKYQSAAINLAVEAFGAGCDYLIRIDAHSIYPRDYCETLIAEAEATGAASVTVTMNAVGQGLLQKAIAVAQNSRFGNGSSAHRNRSEGAWVDHGHHALMRCDAFRAVGGYDPGFTHNEDAELDHRLRMAGYRIWLSARTGIDYLPRQNLRGLIRQYYLFGRGRARNLAKHRMRPAKRQMIVAALLPGLALAVLSPLHWVFALPLLLWALACVAVGVMLARETRSLTGFLAGPLAGLMQAAWSAGFWAQSLTAGAKAQRWTAKEGKA